MLNFSLKLIVAVILTLAQNSNALENGLARTPPMGWINWARFMCQTDCNKYPNSCVNEKLFKDMADRISEDGYAEVGYKYVNIDDCWSTFERDRETSQLVADPDRFPNGLSGVAEYVHSKKLLFGTYGDCGTQTCAGYPSQLKTEDNYNDNYFVTDAQSLAQWNVDSFKFDGCNIAPDRAEGICPKFAAALAQTSKPILLVCEWPFYMLRSNFTDVNYKLVADSCNAWRYYEDVEDSWVSVLNIIDFTIGLQKLIVLHHGPGHWFDPDQLIIGNFGLSYNQARVQMALWCVWSAPLYMSNDLRHINPKMAQILKNKDLINVNQDKLGVFGTMVDQQDGHHLQVFIKPVLPIKNKCPSFVISYLNRNSLGSSMKVTFILRKILLRSEFKLALERAQQQDKIAFGSSKLAEECENRLKHSMTQTIKLNQQNSTVQQQVSYSMIDLYDDFLEVDEINLNDNLTLAVNLNGVRVVKLVEK